MTRQQAKYVTFALLHRPRKVRLPWFHARLQCEPSSKLVLTLKFCLPRYYYSLRIHRSYCGAMATCRYYRPGEDWLRGCDLKDGKLLGIFKVLWSILKHERRPERYQFMWQRHYCLDVSGHPQYAA